ncbi:MAG: transglycosylase domain-containing protein, partial [Gemmatimonadetes bacterium]|nr:transglycosylase domain-containing protein [Gemmatimonadota bacterium]
RNPLRKLKEAVLTRRLERHLSKRRILELYLNVVEFGRGVYGAEAAAGTYFGKSAEWLTEDEAAELAAGLPRPSTWHPGVRTAGYRRYVSEIRRRMDAAPFLWRAVGEAPGALSPADTVGLATPDLDSLLRVVRDSIVIRDSTRIDTGAGPADSLRPRVDTPAVRSDTIP